MKNSSRPSAQEYGKKLNNALLATDKRDRLLWALSQQPAFKEELKESIDNEQDLNP